MHCKLKIYCRAHSSTLQHPQLNQCLLWLAIGGHFLARWIKVSSASKNRHSSVSEDPIYIRHCLKRQCPVRNPVSWCSWFLLCSKYLLELGFSESRRNRLKWFISWWFRERFSVQLSPCPDTSSSKCSYLYNKMILIQWVAFFVITKCHTSFWTKLEPNISISIGISFTYCKS